MHSGFSMEKKAAKANIDSVFIVSLALVAGTGLASLYSASYGYAISLDKAASYFVLRQLTWFAPASLAFLTAAFVPMDWLRKNMMLFVLPSIFMLLLPFFPVIGISKNGAARWFGFAGFMFQPSELVKPMLLLYLAHILDKKSDRLSDVLNGLIPPLAIACCAVFIVLAQNDFSTAFMLALISVLMLWITELPLIFFGAFATIALPLASLSVLTNPYRLRRILGFIVPGYDPANLSYQVNSSIRAIKAGGFMGKGFGQGTLKLHSIPEVYSDFVFSSWVEETGFIGVLFFVALWIVFLSKAFGAAFKEEDSFRSSLVFGSAAYLAAQILINIMVVSGAAPATGLPLPFFSSGGSSLLSVSITTGFIYNILRTGRNSRKLESEYV